MFAAFRSPLTGQPWTDWQDAHLLEDYGWGCSPFTMALRARRTEDEVVARLAALGRLMDAQPRARKIRDTTWTRSARA